MSHKNDTTIEKEDSNSKYKSNSFISATEDNIKHTLDQKLSKLPNLPYAQKIQDIVSTGINLNIDNDSSSDNIKISKVNESLMSHTSNLTTNCNKSYSKIYGGARDNDSGFGSSPKRPNLESMKSLENEFSQISHMSTEELNLSHHSMSERLRSPRSKDDKNGVAKCMIQRSSDPCSRLDNLMSSFRNRCKV